MSDDDRHDWVAHLLAATDHPPMPDDVAERLDRTIRGHVGTVGTTDVAPTDVAPTDGVPSDGVPSDGVPSDGVPSDGVPTGVGPADAAPTDAAPTVGTGPDGPQTTRQTTRQGPPTGTPSSAPATTGALGGLPVAAGMSADAAAQRRADGVRAREQELDRALGGADEPRTADGTTDDTAAGPGATPGVARSGRTWGSSRRERREEDLGERRRRVLTRWVPVAAGVAVLGAAGVTAVNLLPGGGDDAAMTEAGSAASDEAVVPRALVATGTEYSTSDTEAFTAQVRDLVSAAGGAAGEEAALEADSAASVAGDAAEESAPLSSDGEDPASARSVTDSPLSDPEELARCLDEVTAGGSDTATAVDLAVVDGVESTVVVVPDPTGASYFVYVVGPDCSDTRFDFFTITP